MLLLFFLYIFIYESDFHPILERGGSAPVFTWIDRRDGGKLEPDTLLGPLDTTQHEKKTTKKQVVVA